MDIYVARLQWIKILNFHSIIMGVLMYLLVSFHFLEFLFISEYDVDYRVCPYQ